MSEPSLNRRAFLTGVAKARSYTEGQELTRREFSLVAFIAAIICCFLPREAAETLMGDLFGTQSRSRATLTSFDAALKRLYSFDAVQSLMYEEAPFWKQIGKERVGTA